MKKLAKIKLKGEKKLNFWSKTLIFNGKSFRIDSTTLSFAEESLRNKAQRLRKRGFTTRTVRSEKVKKHPFETSVGDMALYKRRK